MAVTTRTLLVAAVLLVMIKLSRNIRLVFDFVQYSNLLCL